MAAETVQPTEGSPHQAEPTLEGLNDTSSVAGTVLSDTNLRAGHARAHKEEGHESSLSAGDDFSGEPQCQITRQGDGLVIASWKHTDHGDVSNDNTTMTDAVRHGPWCSEFRDTRTLILQHWLGGSFMIPWTLCTKWACMKDAIMLTYDGNESAEKEVEEGKFTLSNGRGSIILPDHWHRVIKPFDTITIQLASEKHPMPPPSPLENATSPGKLPDSKYQTGVKYRIDFFEKNRFALGAQNIFLESRSYNDPVGLDKSKSRDRLSPVLEEINEVIFGSMKDKLSDQLEDFTLEVDDKVKPKKLHIRSQLLLNALRSIVRYSSNSPLGKDGESFTDGLFPFPFRDLYHYRQELLELKGSTNGSRANHTEEYNAECDKHIDILSRYLENEPAVKLHSIEERWTRKIPTTTFAGLWLLLKPGTDVYVQENGQLNAYVIDLVSGGIDYNYWHFVARSYTVRVWNLVYNGNKIKRRGRTVDVPVFDGEREITSLPLFPTEFHDNVDHGALRKELIERGRKFFRFTKGPTFLEYTGTGLKQGWRKYSRARVVVEHQSSPWILPEFRSAALHWNLEDNDFPPPGPPPPGFPQPPPPPPGGGELGSSLERLGERARAPRCECSRCNNIDSSEGVCIATAFGDYDSITPSQAEGLTDHQALVCMSHMFGFVLKERSYDILDLNGLAEPVLAESAIDELVLRPESNKTTIKAIARTYTERDCQADLYSVDFIRGKGEGQIFLLHGPPGTDKTLTAESVAEYTKRPLLSITAADLGHDPIELEKNLLRFFKNATAWDAIVLLDEADVYLERRSANDMRRNSVVSIFLRALDYFEGILFFTTNRVGQFDEAFLSRIHVSIGYDPLDDKARDQIWEMFFRKLKTNHKSGDPRIEYEYEAKLYVRKSEDVKKLQWNGREIRNAFQTAVALAISDSRTAREKGAPEEEGVPQVTEAHLSQVVGMSAAFKRYIKATHEGVDQADLAYRLGNRYDRLDADSE